MNQQNTVISKLERTQIPAWIIGGLGVLACVLGYIQNPKGMMQSYLFGFVFWMCLTLGCYGLTLLIHTVKCKWGLSVIRIYEAGGGPVMLIVMALLFLPIIFRMHDLYFWTHTEEVMKHPHLLYKSSYLNVPAFLIRTVIYFAIWILFASILRNSTRREDRTGDPKEMAKRTNLSAPGLVVFVLSVTFAFTDWVMSVDPYWSSTMYGAWFVVCQALTGLAFGTFIVTRFSKDAPYAGVIQPALTKDLGNMIFVFIMLWGYTTLSQYLIIWAGNLPEYIRYFVARIQIYWGGKGAYLGGINVVLQFFVPFFILLSPKVKVVPRLLMWTSVGVLLARVLDIFWNIIPGFRETAPQWTDVAAFVGIGGIWFAVFVSQMRGTLLLPLYDRRLEEVPHHV